MKLKNKKANKLLSLFKRNQLLFIFSFIIFITLVLVIYKSFLSKTSYAYARVLVNYPEAYYSRPDIWLAQSLKRGMVQQGILGQNEAEILAATYYPITDQTQFNIFLDLKLQMGYNKKTGGYSFQRSSIGVGSPIMLNFPSSHIMGTILYIGKNPLKNDYVEKTVYLVAGGGYRKTSPYLYESITIGDKYFDGEDIVFKVVDKRLEKNIFAVVNNFTGQVSEGETETTQDIVIIAKMKLIRKNNLLIFGGNQIIRVGSNLNLFTNSGLNLYPFQVSAVK